MAAMARRDFLEAEAGLRRAEKIEPGRPEIQLQLAQVYARSGRQREAQQAAALAVRLGLSPTIAAAPSTS